MVTSQEAIDETLRILKDAFGDEVSGETGGSHLYGFFKVNAYTFVKIRVADHGVYMQTFVSHDNGIPPELTGIISIVYRETPKTKIGTIWKTTSGYRPNFIVYQYVYPCWELTIRDVVAIAYELITYAKTGTFIPPFLCTKDVMVQQIISDVGIKDVTSALKDKYCKISENKIYKNMKNVKRINESQLGAIVAESVKNVLNEGRITPQQIEEIDETIEKLLSMFPYPGHCPTTPFLIMHAKEENPEFGEAADLVGKINSFVYRLRNCDYVWKKHNNGETYWQTHDRWQHEND